jgi:hypothetical protein
VTPTVPPKHYKATNSVTGEQVEFDWTNPKPPTEDDVNRISDQQRQGRLKVKQQQVDDESKQTFMQKLLTSPAMGQAIEFGKNFEWHPVKGLQDIGEGMQHVIQGTQPSQGPPVQNPRLSGAVQAARGVMGAVGPPALAAGMALAPEVTAPAMAASTVAGPAAQALTPDNWSPEAKQATGMAASLVAGGLSGHAVSSMMEPPPVPPEVPDAKTGDIIRMRRTREGPEPRTGVNYNEPPRFSQKQLPPGTLTPRPSTGIPPGPTVLPPSGKPQIAAATTAGQLPRGPIPMGPVTPPAQGPGPGFMGAGYDPRGTMDEPQAPRPRSIPVPPKIQQIGRPVPGKPQVPALASDAKPLSVTDVSTVSAPPSSPAPTAGVGEAQAPPPPAPAPPQQAMPPVRPPLRPPTPPQPKPPAQTAAQAVTQSPQYSADVAQSVANDQAGMQAVQKPPAPKMGPVQNPMDIAKAALRSSGEQTPSPGPVQPPGQAPKPEMPELPPAQQAAARANNDVLQMLKTRKNVTLSQLQTKLGIPGDVVKQTLQSLKQRGLITQKGATFNYNRVAGEEIKPDEPEPESPPAQISPDRQQRLSDLQKMVGQAEDEGDDPEPIRHLLEQEEKAAEIEKSGTPEQKARLQERDNLVKQARALEDKEESGQDLTPQEKRQLADAYKRVNAMEINDFFRSEEGSSPSVNKRPGDDLNRSFFERWAYQAKNAVNPPEFADIRGLSAELGSPNRVLRDSGIPGAAEIGTRTPEVEVEKYKWLGTTLRQDADHLKDLTDDELTQVARALDVPGAELDDLKNSNLPPRVKEAAVYMRGALDKTFAMFPEGVKKSGEDVGYLSGYLPHIAKQFGDDSYFQNAINDAANYFLGAPKGLTGLLTRDPAADWTGAPKPEGKASLYTPGTPGTPRSPYVESRTGELKDYTLDLKRIIPMYRKLAAKVIFDKPHIDEARELLTQIPDDAPQARAMAEAYLKNYADTPDGYDAIRTRWDAFTGPLMRAHARSLLGLSTRLFSLHGARLLSQIYPEVPTKYFAQGIADTLKDPIGTYQDLGRRGVLPANTVPWFFERTGAKVDRALQAFSGFDFVPDAVGWHGLNRMYLDQGFDPTTAGNMASNKVMDLSMRSTPARMQKMFQTHGPLRPVLQYKQQIMKIAEQYTTQPLDAVSRGDYGRLLRYIIGVGSTLAIGKELGIITAHLSSNIANFGGGAYGTIYSALKKGAKDPAGALKDLVVAFGIPGGNEAKTILKTGLPSAVEKKPKENKLQ